MNMQTIRNSMFIGFGLVLSILSSATHAACIQADYAGTWYSYDMVVDTAGAISPQVNRCKFKVNTSGDIVASKSSCKSRNSSGTFVTDVTGGNVQVGSKCGLRGSIDFSAFGTPFTSVIEHGRVSKDKITTSIVGYIQGTSIISHATGVKR